jgi:hypothetical protein
MKDREFDADSEYMSIMLLALVIIEINEDIV